MNKVTLIGNLGKDPELKQTTGGKSVASFTLATKFKDAVEWHNVVVWERQAEICAEYLKKGRQVCVDGRLQTRKYEKDGQTHWRTEIVANQVIFLGSPGNGQNNSNYSIQSKEFNNPDDMPF